MHAPYEDLARARDAALQCVAAVRETLESVYACTDQARFLENVRELETSLARAAAEVAPLYYEFGNANQHPDGPTCAGVRVHIAPPSSHALAVELARKLHGTLAPVRALPPEAVKGALVDFHRGLLSVMPGDNALAQLTSAKSIITGELDALQGALWTESTMAEALRKRSGPARPRAKAPESPKKAPKSRKKK